MKYVHLDVYNRKLLSDMINNLDIQFFLTGTEKFIFFYINKCKFL